MPEMQAASWVMWVEKAPFVAAINLARTRVALRRKGIMPEPDLVIIESRDGVSIRSSEIAIDVPARGVWVSPIAVNGVTLEPGKIVVNQGSPTVLRALEQEGIEAIQVDFSESQKFAIAGLHCATLELVRDQPGPLLP